MATCASTGETLRLIRCSIDGKPLTALDYLLTPRG
jgi:hypothetical protein